MSIAAIVSITLFVVVLLLGGVVIVSAMVNNSDEDQDFWVSMHKGKGMS